ncbi:MAG: CtkA family protein, partial [Clostridiales bacterium]
HILASIGLPVQDTLLGTYTDKRGKEKLVVACKDFTADGKRLMEFAHLKNTCVDSEQNGYGTELDSILKAIDEQVLIPAPELRAFFWELFVADAWLGNFDRHNGNWGILIDEQKQHAEIAPIYDCGSCLYPQMDVRDMAKVLGDESEINQRIYTFPTSAIVDSGKKISYFDFISSLESAECSEALERIAGRIDMKKVHEIIAATPAISDLQKDFYQTMIAERKEKILDYSMALRMKQQGNAQTHEQGLSM